MLAPMIKALTSVYTAIAATIGVIAAPSAMAQPSDEPVRLVADFNGDGRPETVTVTGAGQSEVDLTIASPGRPTVIAREIAWSLEQASLERATNGSLLLKTSNIGIGRSPHEQTLTIAWRGGAWRVVGITRSSWDRLDENGAYSCDINLLTGRGTAMRPGERAIRPVQVRDRSRPITAWSWETHTPALCRGE